MLRLALWMTGALLSFSAAALSVRELTRSISVFDVTSFRSGTGLLFLAVLAAARAELRRPARWNCTLCATAFTLHVRFAGRRP
jgi:hypothetical protein